MTQKANRRDFATVESRSHKMEKPQLTPVIPAPLLDWLTKIIRRISAKDEIKNTG